MKDINIQLISGLSDARELAENRMQVNYNPKDFIKRCRKAAEKILKGVEEYEEEQETYENDRRHEANQMMEENN